MFVTFEGLDGSGKTDAGESARRGARRRRPRRGRRRASPAAPSSASGSASCCSPKARSSPWAEAALFAAARAQLVEDVIAPAWSAAPTSSATATSTRRSRTRASRAASASSACSSSTCSAIRGLLPDRTFLLLVDPQESARRVGERAATGSSARTTTSARGSTRPTGSSRRSSRSGSRPSTARGPPGEIAEEIIDELRQRS